MKKTIRLEIKAQLETIKIKEEDAVLLEKSENLNKKQVEKSLDQSDNNTKNENIQNSNSEEFHQTDSPQQNFPLSS